MPDLFRHPALCAICRRRAPHTVGPRTKSGVTNEGTKGASGVTLGFGLSIEPQLWTLLFVMVRIGAAFVAAPVFGAVGVPVQVRVALSGAIGVLVLGTHHVTPPAQVFALATFLAIAGEALAGLAIGFILQIAFAAPFVASEVIGTSMGLGFANAIDPGSNASSEFKKPNICPAAC